jgi:uncharacterized repeat protein (TIGR01451 family)
MTITGNILFSGTWSGNGTLNWTTDNDTLSGTGSVSGTAMVQINGNKVVTASASVTLYDVTIASGKSFTNYGTLALHSPTGSSGTASLINAANSTLKVSGTLMLTGVFNPSAFPNTVEYNGTAAQTIPAFYYYNLTISGVRTANTVTLSSTDTIHVANVFSPVATFTSGGYQLTGSIFDYNGTGAQTIAAFNYNNLLIRGARTTNNITFASSGTVGIAGALATTATFTSGGYVTTGSTINYNGAGVQTVNAFWYNNLSISGARTTNNVTLASSDTIRVASTFSPTAAFTSGAYVTTGSTVNFNGSGAQSIPSFSYNNLQTATGGTKTAGGALVIYGNMIIGASSTFDASSTIDTLYANWINNGTFTPTTSEIVFAGPSNSGISGATSFNNLTVNKSSSTINVALSNSIQAVNVSMATGSMGTGPSNTVTITGNRTGNGVILGTVTRTRTFTAGTSYAFEGPYTTLNFNAGGTLPTSVTVFVDTVSPGANTYMTPISRYFVISQTGGSGFTYTMRLHYRSSEVALPNVNSSLKIWQRTSTGPDVWARFGATAADSTANYWVEYSGMTTVGTWSLSSTTVPNIVLTLTESAINPAPGDIVTYTIAYSNTGDGSATNTVVSASTPIHTSYVANSVTVNSVPKTDAADADGVTVSSGNITVNLGTIVGTIAPGGNGTITYQVTIN